MAAGHKNFPTPPFITFRDDSLLEELVNHRPSSNIMTKLEVWGPSEPRLLSDGPSGLLNFVLRALRALRPRDPRNGDDWIVR